MYYQNYEEYMGNTSRYPNEDRYTYGSYYDILDRNNQYKDGLERMYPDTYRIIFPMVSSACDMIQMPITEDMIRKMTDDIYRRIEVEGKIKIEIETQRESNENEKREDDELETRPMMMMRPRNRFLNDLIRILIIRDLIGRGPKFPGIRPPFPGMMPF